MFNASTGTLVGATWVCLISVASIIFEEYNMVQHPELRACIKALPNICSSILARADTIRKDHRGIQLSTFVSFALMLRGLGDFTLELNHTHYGALLALFLYQASYTAYLIVLRREAKYVKEMFTGEILLSVCAAMVCLLGTYSVAINKSVYQDFPMMANLHDLLMGLTVWRLLTRNHSLGRWLLKVPPRKAHDCFQARRATFVACLEEYCYLRLIPLQACAEPRDSPYPLQRLSIMDCTMPQRYLFYSAL